MKALTFVLTMKPSESKYRHCMYFVANALGRRIEKLAIESWKKVDLSPSHAYLLMLAIEEPGIQPTGLSEQLILTPSTITRLIEKLEDKGLVTRDTRRQAHKGIPHPKSQRDVSCLAGMPHPFH